MTFDRTLGVIFVVTAIVTAAYWINYFTSADVAVISARWYTAFESSFPVADGWLAACSLLAGLAYLSGWSGAGRLALLAGSALLYLAAMDITFDVENNMYAAAAHSAAMQFEILINAWSLVLGIVAVASGWRRASG